MTIQTKIFANHDQLVTYVSNYSKAPKWNQSSIDALWYFAKDCSEGSHSIMKTKMINGINFEIIKWQAGLLELTY